MRSTKTRILSFMLAVLMVITVIPLAVVEANAADALQTAPGTASYSLFNSGLGNAYVKCYSSESGRDVNPDSKSYTNNGYDLFGSMRSATSVTIGMGLSFTVNSEITEKAIDTVFFAKSKSSMVRANASPSRRPHQ